MQRMSVADHGMSVTDHDVRMSRPTTRIHARKKISPSANKQSALKALGIAFDAVAAQLGHEMDRAQRNVAELLDLARLLDWTANRQNLIRAAQSGGQKIIAYTFAECGEVRQIKSLAETATDLAARKETLPAALNLLIYIDLEMGWSAGCRVQ
jgi:hypothetical protein